MKLAVTQPYFFPGLGYLDLINVVDRWIVFDTAQYVRHGWTNRNRIHHPEEGWQYMVVPLTKHHFNTPIKDIQVAAGDAWKKRILGQLTHYKRKAPFYDATVGIVEDCLSRPEPKLSRLSLIALEVVCAYVGVPFEYEMFSEMDLDIGEIDGAGDWALRISEAVGASEYFNFPKGERLFDPATFEVSGIRLVIRQFEDLVYDCAPYEFIPGLSIIDVLMWNSPEVIKRYLDAAS